jgi:hypothetical protein
MSLTLALTEYRFFFLFILFTCLPMFLELTASTGTYEQSQRFVKKFHHPNEDDENQVAQHLRINPRCVNNRYENYKIRYKNLFTLFFKIVDLLSKSIEIPGGNPNSRN